MLSFPPKPTVEATYFLPFDFSGLLPVGAEIEDASIEALPVSGDDPTNDLLGDGSTFDGQEVQVQVQNGVSGVIYEITVNAEYDGSIYPLKGLLAVA